MTGPYDELYSRADFLWPPGPGRVVKWLVQEAGLPALVLDLGAGDGKNAIFFEQQGIPVDCFDVSALARDAYQRRFRSEGLEPRGSFTVADIASLGHLSAKYQCVVLYGVAHCLTDGELEQTLKLVKDALCEGGFVCFAALSDGLPIPLDHGTASLHLRSHKAYLQLLGDLFIVRAERGIISERHPGVRLHKHEVSWILARK